MSSSAERLLDEIRALPHPEQLRLLELIAHELVQGLAEEGGGGAPATSVIGLFADEPELIDRVEQDAMQARERDPFRVNDV